MTVSLTMPADHWCPTCGVHNRSQDGHGDAAHTFMAECPVCADKRRTGELPPERTDGSAPAVLADGGSEQRREAAPSERSGGSSLDAWAWGLLRSAAREAIGWVSS